MATIATAATTVTRFTFLCIIFAAHTLESQPHAPDVQPQLPASHTQEGPQLHADVFGQPAAHAHFPVAQPQSPFVHLQPTPHLQAVIP